MINVFDIGTQGPPGAQGAQGPAGAARTFVAAQAISGHTVVALNLAGKAVPASADVAAHAFNIMGMTTNAAAANDLLTVIDTGAVEELGWSWTAGLPLFLGLDGAITQDPRVGVFSKPVGMALTSTKVVFQLQPAVFLN